MGSACTYRNSKFPGVGNGQVWVIKRQIISDGTFTPYQEFLSGNNWVRGHIWYDLIGKQKAGIITDSEKLILKKRTFQSKIKMEIINLHIGYEGYPELIFREKNKKKEVISEVHLLDFDFYEILSLIPLGQYDTKSVMYNYFQSKGWHDGEWESTRNDEFNNQLLLIENRIPQNLLTAYNAVKQICVSTIQNKNKLFIDLE